MTVAAREVLEDCRGAIDEIGGSVQGRAWRRRWVTAVVLLRTVGYVLDRVDTKRSEQYSRAIQSAFESLKRTKPEPRIFWQFIDQERHNIVKEYEVRAGQGVTVHVGQAIELHYLINTGSYAGRDQRDVLREAVAWWELYLDAIDQQADTPRPTS